MPGIRAPCFESFPKLPALIGLPVRSRRDHRPLVVDRVLMNGYTDTIIGLPFPAPGIPLGIGVAQFLLGQVKTD